MVDFPVAVITDEFTQDFAKICETAVELEIPGLELRTAWDTNVVDMSDEQIDEVKRLADASGRKIVGLSSPVFKCTHPKSGEIDHRFEQDAFHAAHTFDDQPRILARALEIANRLDAPIVRVFSFWRSVDPPGMTDVVVETLQGAIEEGRKAGVKIGLENEHACNIATGAECGPILSRIADTESFGIVWDPANAYVSGETPFPEGYSHVSADRILHVHAKDGVMPEGSDRMDWGDVGAGKVHWEGQLAALKADGYSGGVSLETHWGGPGGDKFQGSVICAKSLKRLVAAA